MTLTAEQEAQELTDKVLNIRFTLEKITKQKNDIEDQIEEANKQLDSNKKQNEEYIKANDILEKKVIDLDVQIKAKTAELDEANATFKTEIDQKFAEIDKKKLEQDAIENDLFSRENKVMKDEAQVIQKQKDIEATALGLEHIQKQNAVKEVELKNMEAVQNGVQEVLKAKEDQINVKAQRMDDFERSLLEREGTLIGKLNKLQEWEQTLMALKNAIENDRVNNENEKNRNVYVLRALDEVQKRCITNVGQAITEQVIVGIKKSVLNIAEYIPDNSVIVDKNELEPATVDAIVTPEAEEIAPVVDSEASVENTGDLPQEEVENIPVTDKEELIAKIKAIDPEYKPNANIGIAKLQAKLDELTTPIAE